MELQKTYEKKLGKALPFVKEFNEHETSKENAWDAYRYCKGKGLLVGSTQRDDPQGLAVVGGVWDSLPKWRHLDRLDLKELDGVIVRSGSSAYVMFFEELE